MEHFTLVNLMHDQIMFACATYINFTLVNHIEVVAFITWRGEKRGAMTACEGEREKATKTAAFHPTRNQAFPVKLTHFWLRLSINDF